MPTWRPLKKLRFRMRIDLLRHGECSDQAWLRGRVDSDLSELGWQQMLNQSHKPSHYDKVITSPAKRCAEFAEKTFQQDTSVSIEPSWQERDFGVFDGLSFAEVETQFPQALAHYIDNPYEHKIPQAESFQAFKSRIEQAWSELIHMDYESVLLVTHSGPMRLVLQQILGFANPQLFQFELGYAARISIEVIPTDTAPFSKLVEIVQATEPV